MSPDPAANAQAAYQRLADASPEEFRNLVFQQGLELAVLLSGGGTPEGEMVARIEAEYQDMAEHSPNEWIRRLAAQKLEELRASLGA